MPVSSRYAIDYPLGTEAPDVDGDIFKVVQGIEALAAQFGQGTLAARPVSTPGSPGKQGRIYVVTSGAEINQIHYDYGTGWIHLNPDQTPGANSITSAMIQDNAVGASEIAPDSIGDSELADGVVSAAHLVTGLKPSQGAGGTTEALRALGVGAGLAASGTHASQHIDGGPDPLPAASISQAMLKPGVGGAQFGTAFPTVGLFNGYMFTLFVGGLQAWQFIYRSDLDGNYPWHFVGGAPLYSTSPVGVGGISSPISVPRTGVYFTRQSIFAHLNGMDTQILFYINSAGVDILHVGTITWSSTIGMGMGMIAGYSGQCNTQAIAAGQVVGCRSFFSGSTAGSIQGSSGSVLPVKCI